LSDLLNVYFLSVEQFSSVVRGGSGYILHNERQTRLPVKSAAASSAFFEFLTAGAYIDFSEA
jgi:hypothetical protein